MSAQDEPGSVLSVAELKSLLASMLTVADGDKAVEILEREIRRLPESEWHRALVEVVMFNLGTLWSALQVSSARDLFELFLLEDTIGGES